MSGSSGCQVERAKQVAQVQEQDTIQGRARLESCRLRLFRHAGKLDLGYRSTENRAREQRQACAMKIRDLATNRQTEASTRRFCCEEGLEYLGANGWVDAQSLIYNPDED